MAKQAIILTVARGSGGDVDVTWLFWLPVPAGQQIPLTLTTVSAWTGATAVDNTAIQNGTVIEEVHEAQFPVSMTKAQIQAAIVAAYNTRTAQFAARQNPNQYFGIFFDSVTGWSA
jgi:hypothetical protein